MTNVISFNLSARMTLATRQCRLISGFADHRRSKDDVFWLKENAEVLGILSSMDTPLGSEALLPFQSFYDQIEARLRFFPQYYRFLISICLDLEDLGMPGDTGSTLCAWAAEVGLAEAELSDLQRAEARRLLARRRAATAKDASLDARLHQFINRSETFTLPNKKAAYELTHIVFYLSEYGKRDPGVSGQAVLSLEYAGLLAFLDQNVDLLAEVCAALRFAGQTPSPIWERSVLAAHEGCRIVAEQDGSLNDHYHEYLVTGWAAHVAGVQAFNADVPEGAVRFARSSVSTGALRMISERMFALGETRSGDWHQMRAEVAPYLGPDGHEVLASAEQSSDKFDAFFEGFARAGRVCA
ncbi:MAG: DUF6902 family protein [Sulfitobacter sp.]